MLAAIGLVHSKPATPAYEPPGVANQPIGVFVMEVRAVAIPFKVDARLNVRAVRLLVSRDHGRSWKVVEERDAGDGNFRFTAERDGMYWFAPQEVRHDGSVSPFDLTGLSPSLKVYFNQDRRAIA
jgi:hypothetical protein